MKCRTLLVPAVAVGITKFIGWGEPTTLPVRVPRDTLLAGNSPVAEAEQLSAEDSARERLIFGLRRLEGLEASTFETETGWTLQQLGGASLEQFLESGYLRWEESRLQLTREGLLVSDSLWPALLGDVQ
jgi:oxygen-independent coproporphyrinogen-3 oxidase